MGLFVFSAQKFFAALVLSYLFTDFTHLHPIYFNPTIHQDTNLRIIVVYVFEVKKDKEYTLSSQFEVIK